MYYGNNDWRDYQTLRHSWGTKPEQKAKEKEYNHEYYEKNKERILANRKKNGEGDYEGAKISSSSDIDSRVSSESSDLEDLIKINAEMGGYSDEVMENIRQHNQNIIDNITALSKSVQKYLEDNAESLSDAQKQEIYTSLQTQIDKAKELALDLRKESTKQYLAEIGATPVSGSSQKKSTSNNSSGSSSSKDDETKSASSVQANKMKKPATSSSNSSSSDWWRNGDEVYEEAVKNIKAGKRAGR